MILDLEKFIAAERGYWSELETMLKKLESDAATRWSLPELQRFHYLYERASAGLAKLATASAEPSARRFLESLVARAYSEIHETRQRQHRFQPLAWFFRTLPQTFRRHAGAFRLALLITLAGSLFGGIAVIFDPDAKDALVPGQFGHLMGNPAERVAMEEAGGPELQADQMATFSAELMTNNIGVSLKAIALGMTYGIGTIILLFYNGIILGLVLGDYLIAGQGVFLAGWLLPHGSVEIPAILIGGQAGLVIAGTLLGRGERRPLGQRLRAITPDLVTLIGGILVLLIWAGIVEAFFSQLHAPVLPYEIKIAFGTLQLVLLILFLTRCGRSTTASTPGSSA